MVTVTGHSLAQGDAGLYADGKFYDDYATATYVNYNNNAVQTPVGEVAALDYIITGGAE